MSVNAEHLYLTLHAAASPVHDVRVPADAELQRLKLQPGYLVALFELALTASLADQERQLCAVEFKNHAKLRWSPGSPDIAPLLADEKAALRLALVRACVECPLDAVRSQLLVVLREVLTADFPGVWPEAAHEVVAFVLGAAKHHLLGALDCLHLVFKQFEYFSPDEDADDRKPLHELVDSTFPVLFGHLQAANADASEHGALLRKVIAKIFWKAIMYAEPPALRDKRADRIAPWIDAFVAALLVALPPVRSGVDPARSPGWSARKHVVNILHQLLARFGEPERDFKNKARRAFAVTFADRFFGAIVGALLQQLAALADGVDVPDRYVTALLEALISGVVPYQRPYAVLQPHMLPLITGLVFPLAQPNEAHVQRFHDDPRDFLRREFELDMSKDEIYGSGSAALHFFRQTFLSRPELMPDLVQFLVAELDRYARGESSPAAKCAVLHVLGACNRMLLQRTGPFLARLPQLLSTYVFPELDAADGVLRARACWTLQQFSAVIGDIGAEAASATVQKLLERMRDPALPVRVMAACALGVFVDNADIKPQLEPLIGELLHAFLAMMDEVESDVLILSMQHIVQEFEEAVVPHATALMQAILNKFAEYAELATQGGDGDGDGDGGGDDDDGGEAMMAAAQCLGAVRQVLMACEMVEDVQFWASMIELMLGLAKFIGEGASETFLEEVSQTLSLLIYVPAKLPPNAWDIYDPLMSAYEHGNDTSHLSAMLAPLDNLIERANEGLFVGNRLERLYRAVSGCLLDEETHDAVVIDAVRIYESLILCCGGAEIRATRSEERPPGRIDALLPSLIRDLLTRLQQTEQRMLKCALLDTLLECFLYSVPLTLAALDAAGATDALLRALLECDIDKFFMRMHDKKMVAMGLTALLFSTPLAALPDTVRQLAPVLLAYTLRVIDALQSQSVELTNEEAKRAEMLESLRQNHPQLTEDELRDLASEMHFNQEFGDIPEGQFDDDEDDDEEDGDEEQDYGNEFGGIVDNMGNIERLAAKAAAARGGDFDDIDVLGDMGLEEELSYTCPLDPIQEFVLFHTRFEEAKELEPALLEQIVGAMLPDDRALIDNVAEQFAAYQQDLIDNPEEEE